MSDLIFVSTKQFEELKAGNFGVYLVDSVGAQQIILNDCIIKIFDTPESKLAEAV